MSIRSFDDAYEKIVSADTWTLMPRYLAGHLVIEHLLRKLIQLLEPRLSNLSDSLSHARLIDLVFDFQLISKQQRDVLLKINQIRNNFSHRLDYKPSLKELEILLKEASTTFSDLSDGITQGLGECYSAESIDDIEGWVISELFVQIMYDLESIYESNGGDPFDLKISQTIK